MAAVVVAAANDGDAAVLGKLSGDIHGVKSGKKLAEGEIPVPPKMVRLVLIIICPPPFMVEYAFAVCSLIGVGSKAVALGLD